MRGLWGCLVLLMAGCYQSWQPGGGAAAGEADSPSTGGWHSLTTGGSVATGGSNLATGGSPSSGGLTGGLPGTGGGVGGAPASGGIVWASSGGVAAAPPPTGGAAPSPIGGGPGLDLLNPNGCETPRRFELSIDPSTGGGSVRGWLESTARVSFVDGLPAFSKGGPGAETEGLSLWWSIASVHSQTVYFYGGASDEMSLTAMVAIGATSLADIDLDRLAPPYWVSDAVTVGEVVVIHDARTDTYLGMRVDDVYLTDEVAGYSCSGLDASWAFLN